MTLKPKTFFGLLIAVSILILLGLVVLHSGRP